MDEIWTKKPVDHTLHHWRLYTSEEYVTTNEFAFDYARRYALNSHIYIVSEESYATWKGVLVLLASGMATFVWNFMDVFLLLVSAALLSQLEAFNGHQRRLRHPEDAETRWRTYRRDYFKLIKFIKTVDHHTNKLMALSLISNTYTTSVILAHALFFFKHTYSGGRGTLAEACYYAFIVAYLLTRTYATYMYAASLELESRQALLPMFTCPSRQFTADTERLLQEIYVEQVGLTAFKLSTITRPFVLGMFSFLLSYEFVLVSSTELLLKKNMTNVK